MQKVLYFCNSDPDAMHSLYKDRAQVKPNDDGDANVVAADDHDDDDAQCPECKELRCFVIDVILC